MDQHLEVIGAFFDGERVDTEALRAALAIDEGRAYLVELAAMREIVAMPAVVAAPSAPHSSVWSAKFLLAAAALVAIVGTAGFALGTTRPTTPSATVAQAAPEPTKVLKLEAGTTWKEDRSGKGGE